MFNEENWMEILRAIQYEWPSGTFNCYHHWDALVVHNAGGSGHFFHIKEGMTQGDPLVIITYGIWILSITCKINGVQT